MLLRIILGAFFVVAYGCSGTDFASPNGANKAKAKNTKTAVSEPAPPPAAPADRPSDNPSVSTPTTAPATEPKSDDALPAEPQMPEPPQAPIPELPFDSTGPIEVTNGDYKICTLTVAKDLGVVNDSGLAAPAGYAAADGQASLTLPDYIIKAKGYIVTIAQDDSGARLDINGLAVVRFKQGTYAAATWTIAGGAAPTAFSPPNQNTVNFVASVGGVANMVDTLVQGFELKPGVNAVSGNAFDVYGAFRSLSATLQVRAVVRPGDACPQI